MPFSRSQIAKWLTDHRERLGLSQGDAGKLAGLSSDTISKWERGDRGITAPNFVALVIAYDVDARTIKNMPSLSAKPTELIPRADPRASAAKRAGKRKTG